uniref:Glycosyl hydrolase family 32 N-terminal domain-containing protein n=1 Tax=Leersia perrieri TaxID=77586 RepID=A0A0D9X857_9ORYZ
MALRKGVFSDYAINCRRHATQTSAIQPSRPKSSPPNGKSATSAATQTQTHKKNSSQSPTMLAAAPPLLSPPRRLAVAAKPLRCHAPTQNPPASATAAAAAHRGLLLRGAGSPVVKRAAPGGGGGWLLWYNSGARVALSTSPDGIRWGPPVEPDPIAPSSDWWAFDTAAVLPSDALLFSSGVCWLYYSGSTDHRFRESSSTADDVPVLPGLAISQDGRHWARIEGDHHTGALLGVDDDDGEDPRRGGGWETRCVAAPKVVLHAEGDMRMYYHSFDEMSQRHAIGLARSKDGVRWRKSGKVFEGGKAGSFDECGVRQGHVVRDRAAGRYVMVYEGVDADGRVSIGMAVSEDGLKGWRRSSELPVLRPSDEDEEWDGVGVGSPCLVQMDGAYDWRLYYMGVGRDGEAAIGMAYSEGAGLHKFEKCDAVLM